MKAPCKDCADRVIGCHIDCKRYIDSVNEYEEIKERIREYNICEDVAIRRSLKSKESVERIKKKRRGY